MNMTKFKELALIAVVVLAIAMTSKVWAQQNQQEIEKQGCNLSECFGIKWRTPNLALLKELEVASRSSEGRVPIHYATASCSPQVAFQILAENGASFNIREPSSNLTPLQIALRNCNFATIRSILFYGGDPNALDQETGGNLLHYAMANKMSNNKIRLLAESGADINQTDSQNLSPLLQAMINNDRALIDLLLDNGANPNSYDRNGVGPVHYAAQNNDYDLLRKLRDLGADLGVQSKRGNSPLHILAAQGITPRIVALFTIEEVDPDPLDEGGRTPLHYAAAQTSPESVAALVVLGGNVNQPDAVGDTPLHYALRYNPDPLVIRALLRVGADPNQLTGDGEEPTMLAIKHGDDISAMEILIDYGAEPTAVDETGLTLLHHAVLNRNPNVAASLMSLGADPFIRDNLGRTPYDLSVRVDIADPAREIFAAKKRERDDLLEIKRAQAEEAAADRLKRVEEEQAQAEVQKAARINPAYDFENEYAGENKLKRLQRQIADTEASLQNTEERKLDRKSEQHRKKIEELRQQEENVANKLGEIRRRSNERKRKPSPSQ